jgi:hypothetical protein
VQQPKHDMHAAPQQLYVWCTLTQASALRNSKIPGLWFISWDKVKPQLTTRASAGLLPNTE